MPVALALSRAIRITPREALALLREPRIIPADLSPEAANALVESFKQLGVTAELVNVPPSSGLCDAHPSLTTDTQCERCRKSVCVLCQPMCRACTAEIARANFWKRIRVAVLLLVLASVGVFAVLKQRAQASRHSWSRPLRVTVVLASTEPLGVNELNAWRDGTQSLEQWFTDEATREGLRLETPVVMTLAPNVVAADAPKAPERTGEWVDDSKAALEFRSQLEALANQGGAKGDVRVVVSLRERGAHRVEGIGEAGGSIGLVEGTQGDTKLGLELIAVAHEVLHLVGAHDGYDENGHALPRGFIEPGVFPQKYAEVMVGEIPLTATTGRVPESLDDVRIGEVTAKEIGWK